MITFNSDSMAILASKSEDKPKLNLSFDNSNYSEIEPSVIPFQLLDSSSKRLTDIYFLLHPEELEFNDPENLAKYVNMQTSQNVPSNSGASDAEILSTINSRYNSSFEDINLLLKSLDDDENEMSQHIKKELEKDKSLNDLIERYKSLSNNPKSDNPKS